MSEYIIPLIALAAMEIVLGIDNIVFIAILTDRLPAESRPKARRLGLAVALVMRILLLLGISWVMQLTTPVFAWTDLGAPEAWFESAPAAEPVDDDALKLVPEHVDSEAELHARKHVDGRDLILLIGGLFLIVKTVKEIHHQFDGSDEHEQASNGKKVVTFGSVIAQIAVMDLIFSLDSVITAIGMVDDVSVMITAVVISVGVMIIFADRVSNFVSAHPTLKMLAMSFLMLIGVMLVAEGFGTHIEKGYIYFAMAFSLIVECLNMRVRSASPEAENSGA